MNWLEAVDIALFNFFNQTLSAGFLDQIIPAMTNVHKIRWVKLIIIPAILIFWLYRHRRKAATTLLAMIIVTGATDLLSYRVIKSISYRDRPNNRPDVASVLRVPYGPKSSSFPSNHAANTFAAASTLSLFYPPARVFVYTFAGVIAYSRVYVGVHFVSDVIAGTFMGFLMTCLFKFLLFGRLSFFNRFLKTQ